MCHMSRINLTSAQVTTVPLRSGKNVQDDLRERNGRQLTRCFSLQVFVAKENRSRASMGAVGHQSLVDGAFVLNT